MQGGLGMYLDGGQGYGMPKQYKTDVRSKDHVSANVRRMRQIQRKCKERESEMSKPVKALWKSDKYKDVGSKINIDVIEKEPPTPRPSSTGYLRAHSRTGPPVIRPSRPSSARRSPSPDRMSVPLAECANDVKLIRRNIDFIKLNGVCAKRSNVPRSPSVTALDDLKKKDEEEMINYHKGEVPKYLRHRQDQWKREEEDRIANAPDPALPPGHRVLPEAERKETLALLKQNQGELLRQLQALPLCVDTIRVRQKRQELEGKIAEVEEAIKIFARPKVFVKIE